MTISKRNKFLQPNGESVVDVGKMVATYLKQKRLHKSALARDINRNIKTLDGYFNRPSIQTAILWELCHALKHNFFADIAALLPVEYPATKPKDTAPDERIAELEAALHQALAERDLLKAILSGKAG